MLVPCRDESEWVVENSNEQFVTRTLNSAPGGVYTIEFFAGGALSNVSIGTTTATTDAAGNAFFSTTLPLILLATDVVTATATDSAGSTSEISPGIQDSMGVSTVSSPRAAPRRLPDRHAP